MKKILLACIVIAIVIVGVIAINNSRSKDIQGKLNTTEINQLLGSDQRMTYEKCYKILTNHDYPPAQAANICKDFPRENSNQ